MESNERMRTDAEELAGDVPFTISINAQMGFVYESAYTCSSQQASHPSIVKMSPGLHPELVGDDPAEAPEEA